MVRFSERNLARPTPPPSSPGLSMTIRYSGGSSMTTAAASGSCSEASGCTCRLWFAQDECYTTENVVGAIVWELPGH
jgi:hypothetical protein